MPTATHTVTPDLGSYDDLHALAEGFLSTDLDRIDPVSVDTLLAELFVRTGRARSRRESQFDTLHRLAGDSRHYVGRRQVWSRPAAWAETAAATLADEGEFRSYEQTTYLRTVAALEALRDEIQVLARATANLEGIYARRPWSRFFLVTSSDGHVHSNLYCSTCRLTTEFGWLPDLSGRTEAEVVADQGPLLCTVCYPSAPVAWTVGREKPAGCVGSNKQPVDGTARRSGRSTYGECTGCGQTQSVTMSGIRKHKPPTS